MRAALAATLVFSTLAVASPKAVAVAMGDCREPSLRRDMAELHDALRARWGDALHSPEVVLSLLQPRPALSLNDLKHQVESARTLFYGGQYDRARELARQAVVELEKAPPSEQPWPVLADALLLEGLALKALDRKAESTETFRRVLRVDPAYQLNPDYFTPTTLQAFDALRKELARGKKHTLTVQSLPGAEVFLDGRPMGAAPTKLVMPASAYRVWVASGGQVSFPHVVTVNRDTTVSIDLAFESALSPELPLCLKTAAAPDAALASALASSLGAEQVVMVWSAGADGVRTRALKNGAPWRETSRALSPAAAVEFIVTGVAPAAAAPLSPPALLPTPSAPVAAAQIDAPSTPPSNGARIAGYALLGAGVALVASGPAIYMLGDAERQRLGELTANGQLPPPSSATHQEARELIPRVDANRTLSLALGGAGLGLAAAGVLAVVLFGDDAPNVVMAPSP
ncbi:MAG: PEGA domain-containing protein, partial [Archangium sp.]|nr:PEGA domain-containing protein [Archangium sp.]